jgi:hypothetical protein
MENNYVKHEKPENGDDGNGSRTNDAVEAENRRLQKLLKRAVNIDKAPKSLRERIGKMIREK